MKQNFILLTLISLTTIISCVEKDSINLPKACFNITPNAGKAGDEIQFSNCSKNATHFVWTFGDGESSTQKEPLHIYRKKGNYEIRLLAGEDKNNDGILNLLDEPDSTF